MSKTTKRKPSESKNGRGSSKGKETTKRPSVFERLGTKATSLSGKRDRSSSPGALSINTGHPPEFCRHWIQNGSCPYGKNCKLANSHTLISPSKRSSKREDSGSKSRRSDVTDDKRVVSALVKRGTPDLNSWDNWDQNNLEYEDEKVLEKRLLLLQRELDLQMKKDARKPETSAKTRSRSSSSSSSSSSDSSSSSASSSGSSAIQRSIKKNRRATPPSPSEETKKISKSKESPSRKSSGSGGSKRYLTPPKKIARKKSISPTRKVWPQSPGRRVSLTRRKDSPTRRGLSSDRKKHRSVSRTRQRVPPNRRQRTPECKGYSRQTPRNRSIEKKKDEGKIKDDIRRDRKPEYKNMGESSRRVDKARELRVAREKERTEALERCRERQREREAAAKEKERMREDRERERKETAARRDRERKDRRGSRERRRILPPDTEKRHDRSFERYERKDKEKSYERERVRDRALERVMDRKSDERRARSRDSFERPYDSRRILQDSPYRERRYEGEREHISPRDDRYRAYPDDRKRERRERVSGSWAEGRYDDSKGNRSDWVDREFQDTSRRDWETREDGSEDWATYSSSGNREWHARPHNSIPHHEERRAHKSVDKESIAKDKELDVILGKRLSRSGDEGEDTPKRPRIEESSLQEELSDISDDADDILNREDIEFADVEENKIDDDQELEYQLRRSSGNRNSRLTEEGLDFEEISDEELEDDKTNKAISVGDALGVDWRSLMDECKKQRKKDEGSFSARTFWHTENILSRIGISTILANSELITKLKEKYPKLIKDDNKIAIQTIEKNPKVSDLVSSTLVYKQAISARADISIRRQLCGLPVVSLETHPNLGLCQWAV